MAIVLLSGAGGNADAATAYPASETFELVLMLLIMVAVIAAAYFLTRFIAGGALRMQRQTSRMRVVDRVMIARDRAVVVVELGGRYFMLGIGSANINMLCEVDGTPYRGGEEPSSGGILSALQERIQGRGAARRGGGGRTGGQTSYGGYEFKARLEELERERRRAEREGGDE